MLQKDALFWIWLSDALGPKSRDFRRLIALYDNPYDLFHADDGEIERISDITPRAKEAILKKDLSSASRILDDCQRLGINILTFDDEEYPHALRELKAPPFFCTIWEPCPILINSFASAWWERDA